MRNPDSRTTIYAAIAALVAVTSTFAASIVLLQTKSDSGLVFAMVAVGASLLAAFITLVRTQWKSAKNDKVKPRVFLSYAKEDQDQVETLYKKLEAEGFEPWMDVKKLDPEENWTRGIERAINNSDYLVALISKHSLDRSGLLGREMKMMLDLLGRGPRRNLRIIPVRLDDSITPEPLTELPSINLYEENGFSKLIRALQAPFSAAAGA